MLKVIYVSDLLNPRIVMRQRSIGATSKIPEPECLVIGVSYLTYLSIKHAQNISIHNVDKPTPSICRCLEIQMTCVAILSYRQYVALAHKELL